MNPNSISKALALAIQNAYRAGWVKAVEANPMMGGRVGGGTIQLLLKKILKSIIGIKASKAMYKPENISKIIEAAKKGFG